MSRPIINRDFHGKPVQGIPIHSNAEWIGVTTIGIVIMHFLVPPLMVAAAIFLGGCAAIGAVPGFILISITHSNPHLWVLYGIVLGLGVIPALSLGMRKIWRLIRRFIQGTQYRFENGYRGPAGRWVR